MSETGPLFGIPIIVSDLVPKGRMIVVSGGLIMRDLPTVSDERIFAAMDGITPPDDDDDEEAV